MNKFKTGEKVKVIEIDKITGEFYEEGEILTIKSVNSREKILLFENKLNCGLYFDQVEKDKYNLNLSFKEVMSREVQDTEIWESYNYIIKLRKSGGGYIEHKIKSSHIFGFNEMKKFKLQRPKVGFDIALKAYFEGKLIKSCMDVDYHVKREGFTNSIDIVNEKERQGKWTIY